MEGPERLSEEAKALADYFDKRGLSPARALAICGLFCSTMMSGASDKFYEAFKATMDLARSTNEHPDA